MKEIFMRFPGGLAKALTFSYDDAVWEDIRLTAIFKQHRLKATFNINSGLHAPEGTVQQTGGLKDSIRDSGDEGGFGFTFQSYNADDMLAAIDRALAAYADPEQLATLRARCMTEDFSWGRSANEYIRLYKSLLKGE